MANKELNVKIVLRNDTAENWTSSNPVLLLGELGFETDTGKFKCGDGSTAWNDLGYLTAPGLKDDLTGDYLPLSGGTMTGAITLPSIVGAIKGQAPISGDCLLYISLSPGTTSDLGLINLTGAKTRGLSVYNPNNGSAYGIEVDCTGTGEGIVINNRSGTGMRITHQNNSASYTGTLLALAGLNSATKAIYVSSGTVSMNLAASVSVPTPTEDNHAATKAYVDEQVASVLSETVAEMIDEDLNTYTTTGNYFVSSSSSLTNAPSVNSAITLQNVFLNVVAYNTSNLTQTLTCVPSNNANTVYRYVRLCADGTWKDWQQIAPQ